MNNIMALINTAKYAYYKQYVENLEKEHDRLVDENESLKRSEKRYREMCVRLKKKLNTVERILERYRNG